MQEYGINMADIRNQLQVSSIRTKVEAVHLTTMGHILRLPDESYVNNALLVTLLVNNIRKQNKIKEQSSNDNTMLEKIDRRGWHGMEYDRRRNIKSLRLEGKSKEETTAYGRV